MSATHLGAESTSEIAALAHDDGVELEPIRQCAQFGGEGGRDLSRCRVILGICALHEQPAVVTVGSLQAGIDLENRTQIMTTMTEDMPEAVMAFLQKRPPEFKRR